MQSIMQGFRVVGTESKLGPDCLVVAYEVGELVDLEYLNGFVQPPFQVAGFEYKSAMTLQAAKEKYPEWYQTRIVEGKKRSHWKVKKDLYTWWLNRIRNEVSVGHRYFAIMCLAVYAQKCGVSEDELHRDAFSLLEQFDKMSETEENRFTNEDIANALEMYNESYVTYPRDDIARISGLSMPVNKRNGLPQKDHLEIMNAIRAVKKKQGNVPRDGRPNVRNQVAAYMRRNPEEKNKSKIARELGLHRDTIGKWYAIIKSEVGEGVERGENNTPDSRRAGREQDRRAKPHERGSAK